jgi:hypothetical protein
MRRGALQRTRGAAGLADPPEQVVDVVPVVQEIDEVMLGR